jgi:hypothetical protein
VIVRLRTVDDRPITLYEVAGGYLDLAVRLSCSRVTTARIVC